MKLLFGTLILGAAASVFAQDAPLAPAAPATPAMPVRAAIMPAMTGDVFVAGVTKNAPFTADESGETVRVMPDGNRIVENWTGKMARNSLGRIRRDVTSGKVGGGARPFVFDGTLTPAPAVVALGSTGDEIRHVMMAKIEVENAAAGARTIVASPAPAAGGISVYTTSAGDETKRAVVRTIEGSAITEGAITTTLRAAPVASEMGAIAVTGVSRTGEGKSTTRKEDLGTRDFGGVQAEGHRIITTYAAGAIGNDRELEVSSEIWFAKDLGVVVYSKRSDPRTGETTYQMTNIVRAEPDASLFQIR